MPSASGYVNKIIEYWVEEGEVAWAVEVMLYPDERMPDKDDTVDIVWGAPTFVAEDDCSIYFPDGVLQLDAGDVVMVICK